MGSEDSRLPRFRSLAAPETLRLLVRNLPVGVYVTSEAGEILDANPGMLALAGVGSLEELRQYRAEDLFAAGAGHRELQRELLEQTGVMREQELRLRRPDGGVRTVLDTCYRVRCPDTGEVLYHGVLIDITERKMFEQQLKEMSARDPLTGCFNRRRLTDVEAQRLRDGLQCGAIVVDIDNFKRYNDERGHQAGDEALVSMAHFLLRETRAHDVVVRLGGDEFLVLLMGEHAESTAAIAARLSEAAAAEGTVPFSLGWAVARPGESLEKVIQRADHRLLEVRAQQRGERRGRRPPLSAER